MVDINALDLASNPQAGHHQLPDLALVQQILNMPENAAQGEKSNFTSPVCVLTGDTRIRHNRGLSLYKHLKLKWPSLTASVKEN